MVTAAGFWDIVWSIFWVFAFVAYLFALFAVITDLFRDHRLSGWWKALWIVAMVFVPFLTVLAYLIVRAPGMQERAQLEADARRSAVDAHIRQAAGGGGSPADEISKAKALLDAGAISAEEFDAIKSHAMSAMTGR